MGENNTKSGVKPCIKGYTANQSVQARDGYNAVTSSEVREGYNPTVSTQVRTTEPSSQHSPNSTPKKKE